MELIEVSRGGVNFLLNFIPEQSRTIYGPENPNFLPVGSQIDVPVLLQILFKI